MKKIQKRARDIGQWWSAFLACVRSWVPVQYYGGAGNGGGGDSGGLIDGGGGGGGVIVFDGGGAVVLVVNSGASGGDGAGGGMFQYLWRSRREDLKGCMYKEMGI